MVSPPNKPLAILDHAEFLLLFFVLMLISLFCTIVTEINLGLVKGLGEIQRNPIQL